MRFITFCQVVVATFAVTRFYGIQATDDAPVWTLGSPTTANRSVLLIALPDSTTENEAIFHEWDSFAGSIKNKDLLEVKILCTRAFERDHSSSFINATPFVIPDDDESTWFEILRHMNEYYPNAPFVGLSAGGTLPSQDLEDSVTRLLEAFKESPEIPTAVVGRSRVKDPSSSNAEPGTEPGAWLSDMLVTQMWYNTAGVPMALGDNTELSGAKVLAVSSLEAISLFLGSLASGGGGNNQIFGTHAPRVVDGSNLLRVEVDRGVVDTWCSGGRISSSPHFACDPPNEIVRNAVRPTHEDYDGWTVRNVAFAISDLELAATVTVRGNSTPVSNTFRHAPWPPSYILETVSSKEGLVIVTSVNCGYLNMAMNFLSSVQRQSDAKVRR